MGFVNLLGLIISSIGPISKYSGTGGWGRTSTYELGEHTIQSIMVGSFLILLIRLKEIRRPA